MDFVADQLADGRKIRTLTIIDLFTRECLGIEVGFSLRSNDVVAAMGKLEYARGLPQRISCDNGSEFLRRPDGSVGLHAPRSNGL
jgi:putative transposase